MSYVLRLRDVIVGRSDLSERDPDRRVAHGAFRPGLGWDLVEPIFALADEGASGPADVTRYRAARDALALVLYGPRGHLVETSRIDVLRDETSATGLVLDVAIVDPAFWGD